MTQASTTTTTTTPPVQKKEESGTGGGAQSALRGSLRGMSFADGAAALAPVQRKTDGPGATPTKTPPVSTEKTSEPESTETTETTEPEVVDKGAVGVGQHGSMHGFLGAIAAMPETFLSGGKTVKVAFEGEVTTAYILKLGLKMELEITKKQGGGYETSAKFHVGLGLGFEAGVEEIAKAEFMIGLCGDYNLKSSGDSFGECCSLMWLSVETSMRQAAMSHNAEAPAEDAPGQQTLLGRAWGLFKRAVLGTYEKIRSWSLGSIIGVIWGDAASYEDRKSKALADMDADDSAESEAMAGFEGKGGVEIGGQGGEVEGSQGQGTKTKLEKGADGKLETTREKGTKNKVGLTIKTAMGEVKAEIEEFTPEGGKAEGELIIECKGGVANWIKGGAAGILGIINLVKTRAGSTALKGFVGNLAADAAAIVVHHLHEHAEEAAGEAAHGAVEKVLEAAVEAGFEFKFTCSGGEWKLEAVELLNEVELGINLHAFKAKSTVVVKQSVYHNHGGHEGGEHDKKDGGHH